MSLFDDDLPKKNTATHIIGSDLSLMSVDELTAHINILQAEIQRLEAERERKSIGRKAAESLFRS